MYPTLAIDYGQKYIGIAVSDSTGLLAQPVEVIKITGKTKLKGAIERISEVVKEYRANSLLFGLPQAFTPAQEQSVEKVEKFIEKVTKVVDLPYFTIDESFSTSEAENVILSSSRRSKEKGVDKIAAAIFLQEFLDQNKQNEKSFQTNG
jgi:putative Holliday junction resolvase